MIGKKCPHICIYVFKNGYQPISARTVEYFNQLFIDPCVLQMGSQVKHFSSFATSRNKISKYSSNHPQLISFKHKITFICLNSFCLTMTFWDGRHSHCTQIYVSFSSMFFHTVSQQEGNEGRYWLWITKNSLIFLPFPAWWTFLSETKPGGQLNISVLTLTQFLK